MVGIPVDTSLVYVHIPYFYYALLVIEPSGYLPVMEQPLVLSYLILSTMPLLSYQINYSTLQFGCVMEQPLSPLSYLFDLINYASLILLNKLSILFHPIIVWPCG